MALSVIKSFRIAAVRATFLGLPFPMSRVQKLRMVGL